MKRPVTSIYLAGPMLGHAYFNFPAFLDAAEQLRAAGYRVANPADVDIAGGFDFRECPWGSREELEEQGFDRTAALLDDFRMISEVDAVVLLPGWEQSTGARAEKAVATAFGLPVYLLPNGSVLKNQLVPVEAT